MLRLLFVLLFIYNFNSRLLGQIENVIIEKYYISDQYDATDTFGGLLPEGSITYRIFVDLKPGSKIKKIYGDAKHPIIFKSSHPFFNHKTDGQSFARNFNKARYSEGTVALDSWLTLGQTTRTTSTTNFGILKSNDRNGSFVGGKNNDGGSAEISGGLLINADPKANLPLTTSDGMDTMSVTPTNWSDYGFIDAITGEDLTIFGSNLKSNSFVGYEVGLQNSGVAGVLPGENHVLVAQLTTLGEDLSFEINLEIEETDQNGTKLVKYVADDKSLEFGEEFSPFLKYPFICGCQDPNYLEARKKYACEAKDSCKTLIVFGCTDSLACNYNPNANYNISTLCCYVGYCNDLDLSIICPNLKIRDQEEILNINVYPSIVFENINISVSPIFDRKIQIRIFDSFGKIWLEEPLRNSEIQTYNVNKFPPGLYFIRISSNEFTIDKKITKI